MDGSTVRLHLYTRRTACCSKQTLDLLPCCTEAFDKVFERIVRTQMSSYYQIRRTIGKLERKNVRALRFVYNDRISS